MYMLLLTKKISIISKFFNYWKYNNSIINCITIGSIYLSTNYIKFLALLLRIIEVFFIVDLISY